MDSLSGKLLVASPDLADPNFARSVVLMVHHEDEGAFGLILNRTGRRRLGEVWEDAIEEPCPADLPLSIGGPVAGPIVVVHGNAALSELEILPGVHFAAQKELVAAAVAEGAEPLRVFAGYSGWAGGQLEEELEQGSWLVTDARTDLVFGDEDTLWRRVGRRISDDALVDILRVRHVPEQPWHN
jgi:putative transcriptional regulator